MKYKVRWGYSYVDVNGRNQVLKGGEIFDGEVDPSQKWKLGALEQEPELKVETKSATQTKKTKTKTEAIDPLDEGEETE
jgi:hypothetical protein